jgi:hypothetical protein
MYYWMQTPPSQPTAETRTYPHPPQRPNYRPTNKRGEAERNTRLGSFRLLQDLGAWSQVT